MTLRAMAVAATISAVWAVPAFSQNAPADLIAAYRAGVAGQKCDLGLDSGKSSKLGDAVQRIEQRSGLAQADLDALWSKTEAEADADLAGFCANAGAAVDKTIAAGG
jgi:hypothetical protein